MAVCKLVTSEGGERGSPKEYGGIRTGGRAFNPAPRTRLLQDAANERRRTLLPGTSVSRPFGFASDGDEDFSSGVSPFQIPDGLGDLRERVRPVDHRCDLPGFYELLED